MCRLTAGILFIDGAEAGAWQQCEFTRFLFFLNPISIQILFLLTQSSMSHVHVVSSDPPLLRQRPGTTPTELGHVEPEASSSYYFTSRVRTSRPFGGTQTSESDSIYHRQQPALRTNRAAKINDEFWTPIAGQYQTFSTRCIVSWSADLSSVCCCFFPGGGAVGGVNTLKVGVKVNL